MKLQKQLSRRVSGKEYPKYVMTIPPNCVEKLGWQKGTELKTSIQDNKLIVETKD